MRSIVAAVLVTLCLTSSAQAAQYRTSPRAQRLARSAGEVTGFTGGAVVTALLALSPKWSKRTGQMVTFDRGGHPFAIEARHISVVGPKIKQQADRIHGHTMPRDLLRSFLSGTAEGATFAPPSVARLEALMTDAMIRHTERRR